MCTFSVLSHPPLPLSSSVAVRSAAVMPQPPLPAPPRPRCMQNRISKTLLTLLILLKNLSSQAIHFFAEINFFSKVSKVFEILFCKIMPKTSWATKRQSRASNVFGEKRVTNKCFLLILHPPSTFFPSISLPIQNFCLSLCPKGHEVALMRAAGKFGGTA